MLTDLDPCVIRDLEFEVVRMRTNYPKQIEKHELANMEEKISLLNKFDQKIKALIDFKPEFNMKTVLSDEGTNVSFKQMESDIEAFTNIQNQGKFLESWLKKKKQATLS